MGNSQSNSSVPTATVVAASTIPATPSSSVTLTVTSEMSVYSTSACEATFGINLAACPAPSDVDRSPVDCVVVTDVSGSMAGSKLDLVKQTVKLLLDEFGPRDRVGLVTFDTAVRDRLGLVAMDQKSKATAASVVDSFRAGSATNLSGGLFAGLQQLVDAHKADVKNHKEDNGAAKKGIKTILLMTDGQANYGLRTASEIILVLHGMLAGTNIALHTFGYGAGHDSTLLRSLATTGQGSYYFVENSDDIRSAFGDCLGGLLSVVAQNLVLEVAPLDPRCIIKTVHHKAATPGAVTGTFRVPFADLYADERRDVLVTLQLPAQASEAATANPAVTSSLRATLKYVDLLTARAAVVEADGNVPRACPGSAMLAAVTRHPELERQRLRLVVAATIDDARATAEKGNLASARAAVQQARSAVSDAVARQLQRGAAGEISASEGDAGAMLPSFLEDLDECTQGLVDRTTFRSATHKMAMMSEGHTQQRCMESRVEISALSDGGASKMRSNAYRTKSKHMKGMAFAGLL